MFINFVPERNVYAILLHLIKTPASIVTINLMTHNDNTPRRPHFSPFPACKIIEQSNRIITIDNQFKETTAWFILCAITVTHISYPYHHQHKQHKQHKQKQQQLQQQQHYQHHHRQQQHGNNIFHNLYLI